MSVTLIDNAYYAKILRRARRSSHLHRADIAQALKISQRQWYIYEKGRVPIPENILQALLCNGMIAAHIGRNVRL